MSAANPLLVPTTAAVAAFPAGGYNANEDDAFFIVISGNAFGAAENIKVWVLDSAGTQRQFVNQTSGVQYVLDNSGNQVLYLPGGALYSFSKTASALATGLDVLKKPRIGFSGA